MKNCKQQSRQHCESFCRHASLLHFSLSTAHRMLKHDLGYQPYKLQIVQELKKTDLDFCKQFLHLQLLEDTELFFSVEAHFDLSGFVNTQNMHHWLTDNPNWQITKSVHSEWVTMWCAISRYRIIGPFFRTKTDTLLVLSPCGMKRC